MATNDSSNADVNNDVNNGINDSADEVQNTEDDSGYLDFIKTRKIVASFNIGKQRITEAILDFTKVLDSVLILNGIKLCKTNMSTAHTNAAKKLLKAKKITSAKVWLKEKADAFSGTEIDMSEYVGKQSWNLIRGEQVDDEQVMADNIAKKDDLAELDRLEALIQKRKEELLSK